MVTPVLIGMLGTLTKWAVLEVEDLEIRVKVETIQTKTLLWSAIILRRILVT